MNNRKITRARQKFTQFVQSIVDRQKTIKIVHVTTPTMSLVGKPTNPNVIYDPSKPRHHRTIQGSIKKHGKNLTGIHGRYVKK